MIKNNRGVSIVEVLVVVVLVALVASLSAGFVVSQRKQTSLRQMRELMGNYLDTTRSAMSLSSICTSLLPKTGQYSAGSGQVDLVAINNAGVDRYNLAVFDDVFETNTAILRYRTLDMAQAAQGYQDRTYINIGNEREILGDLEVTLSLKSGVFAGDESYSSVRGMKFNIPIKLYDEQSAGLGARAWTGVVCAAEDADEAIYRAQICNLYGGTLSDGAYCDFARVVRNNTADAVNPPRNTAVQKVTQTGTNRVQRVRLNEIMCYIDSLIVLTEGIASVAAPTQKVRTTFCRHPGGNSEMTISRDAAKFFAN